MAKGFDIIKPSDVLRTAGAVFFLTRKHKLVKVLGWLWLGSEIYSLTQRENSLAASALPPTTFTSAVRQVNVRTKEVSPPYGSAGYGDWLARQGNDEVRVYSGDALMKPAFAGFLGYAG